MAQAARKTNLPFRKWGRNQKRFIVIRIGEVENQVVPSSEVPGVFKAYIQVLMLLLASHWLLMCVFPYPTVEAWVLAFSLLRTSI